MSPGVGTAIWLMTHDPIRTLKAVLSSALYLLVYVVLPSLLVYMAQGDPQIRDMLDMAKSTVGIDAVGIANTVMLLGISVAILVLIRGLTDKWSATNLLCEVASTILHLAIVLTILGAGDIGNLGVISRTVQASGPSQPSFTIDMRSAAFALMAIAGVRVILAFAVYLDARKERTRRLSPGDVLRRMGG